MKKFYNDKGEYIGRQLVEDVEGYKAFEEKYKLPVEQYLSTLSLMTIVHIMHELGINFTDVSTEELLEFYQYQTVVETLDGEIFEKVSLLDDAIQKVKEKYGLVPSLFKEQVIDMHASLPVLKGRRLTLKPLQYDDLYDLEKMRKNDTYTTFVNRGTLTTSSHTAFISELQWQFLTSRDIQYIISYKGVNVGTIFSYDNSPYDGRALFSLYLSDEAPVGLGVEAVVLFFKFVFDHHNLKTLSTEVYDTNEHVLNMWRKVGAEQTGYLKDYRQNEDNSYTGLYRFTITRELAQQLWERFLPA